MCSLVVKALLLFVFYITVCQVSFAQQKTIALTIDDLPFVGEYRNFHLKMMMDTMLHEHIPATGFIIASEVRHDNWPILHEFKDAGFSLGNHTYSHANLNRLSVEEYAQEIKKADVLLKPVLTKPKYFRYPYLAMSSGAKKDAILCYLAKRHYQVAPITIDSKDFAFNQRLLSVPELKRRDYLEQLKPFYLDFIWQQTLKAEDYNQYHHHPEKTQILLIHANLLNAYVLPDLIHLYKQQGYKFVALDEALNNPDQALRCKQKKTTPSKSSDAPIESYLAWD